MYKESVILPNEEPRQVTVSFVVPYDGWLRLRQSKEWKRLDRRITEIQKGHNRMYLQG